jgi:fluoride exporter
MLELETWYRVAVLSVGGVLGVNARFWLGVAINRWTSSQFPWATFMINITGSFAIGLCTAVLARWLPHPHARLLVIVGFLGGYTTFSSYSIESLTLWERGERGLCLTYLIGSVVAGFAAVVLGTMLGRGLQRPETTTDASAGNSSAAVSQAFPLHPGSQFSPPSLADGRHSHAHPPARQAEEPEAS